MSVIEQQMYFAACEDCDWQSVLKYEAALAEMEERTHRSHAHGSTDPECWCSDSAQEYGITDAGCPRHKPTGVDS